MNNCKTKCCVPVVNQFYCCGCCQDGGNGSSIKDWTLLSEVSGKELVTLPEEFNELHLNLRYTFGTDYENSNYMHFVVNVLKDELKDEPEYYELSVTNGINVTHALFLISKTSAQLWDLTYNNVSVDENSVMTTSVYYK